MRRLYGPITITLIVLGLLFVALGWNLPVSQCDHLAEGKSYYAPDYKTPKGCGPTLGSVIHSFFEDRDNRDILLVVFTGFLAFATFFLFDATAGLLKHVPHIERAYISGGGARHFATVILPTGQPSSLPTGQFALHINNHGKTPGELHQIAIGFCEEAAIPDVPAYNDTIDNPDWIGPGTQSRPIRYLDIPTTLVAPVIFGRFYYSDIFGKAHSSGFILSLTSGVPILASKAYTEAT